VGALDQVIAPVADLHGALGQRECAALALVGRTRGLRTIPEFGDASHQIALPVLVARTLNEAS
jgi:hypothetical protein